MAYYSRLQRATYHEYSNCSVGNNMVYGNLIKGKPKPVKGRGGEIKKPKLCGICAGLRRKGKGIPGVPILPKVHAKAKVLAYHSLERPEIFHICQNCFLGQNIERAQLRRGKPAPVKGRGGKTKKPRVCKICARLCRAGDCIPGAPIPARMRKPRPPAVKAKRPVSRPKPPSSKPKPRIPTVAAASK
jgi:hypothetical protein